MAHLIWYTFLLGGIGILFFYIRHILKYWHLPPGPRGWPLVGNAFQQNPDRPYLSWAEWAGTFGDVFTVKNFGRPSVICNKFETIYEIYVNKSFEFAGRPDSVIFNLISDNGSDITLGDFSPEWRRRKKIFLSNIRMYGDGLIHLEEIMVDILDELGQDIKQANEKPINLYQPFIYAIVNTLTLLILGEKFERSDKDFQTLFELIKLDREVLGISLQSVAIECFPFLLHLPLPLANDAKKYKSLLIHEWLPTLIKQKMDTYYRNKPRCILDAYIKQHEDDKLSGIQYPIEKTHLVQSLADFFMAGVSSSSATLYAMFAVLTTEQDIQAKLREEVDRVIVGRLPELKYRIEMPYYQAVMEEVMRYCVIVPTSMPHKALTGSKLCGFFIPKGTEVIPNIWSMCHDEKVWGDPWKFRPERFLDENGEMIPIDHPKRRSMMVFGAGRRICPGENLARNRIFLITTSLLQNFLFQPAKENQPPVHDPRSYKGGVIIMPEEYKVIAVPRY